jgi:hypothetical protein
VSDRQASVRGSERRAFIRKRTGQVLVGLVELAALFALIVLGRFALSSFQPSHSWDNSFDGTGLLPPAAPRAVMPSLRRSASFDGHPYLYTDDPQNPGHYAVVFTPAVKCDDDLTYAAIRNAVLTAYGQDLSGVIPEISRQGDALRVGFQLDGIAYVAMMAWRAPLRELTAFSLHREE